MVVCKRTYFDKNEKVIFIKNKIYKTNNAADFSMSFDIYIEVITEMGIHFPMTIKTFNKHFYRIEDVRNKKIEKLLNE
jgi:hypothetical protein